MSVPLSKQNGALQPRALTKDISLIYTTPTKKKKNFGQLVHNFDSNAQQLIQK